MSSHQTFETLYIPHHTALFKMALITTRSRQDAEDALQEALLLGMTKFEQLRDQKHFKTWLTRIVLNCCYAIGRKSCPTVELADEIAVEFSTEEFELLDAIEMLDEKTQELIKLRFWGGLSVAEIAVTLDIPSGTVKSRLSRAIDKLRAELTAAI